MTGKAKFLFVLSILMAAFCFLGGAAAKSGASGIGVVFWAWTSWMIWNSRFQALSSTYQKLVWIEFFLLASILVLDLSVGDHYQDLIKHKVSDIYLIAIASIFFTATLRNVFNAMGVEGAPIDKYVGDKSVILNREIGSGNSESAPPRTETRPNFYEDTFILNYKLEKKSF